MRVYTVRLEAMEFVAFHGCREDEKVNGNIFSVDFEGDYASDCADTDALERAINYGEVYRLIASVMRGRRCDLLETLADSMVGALHVTFPGFTRIKVSVGKKNPPVAGPCAWSRVSTQWTENE